MTGKWNRRLNRLTVRTAGEIAKIDARPAQWIASDALRELTCDRIQRRLNR